MNINLVFEKNATRQTKRSLCDRSLINSVDRDVFKLWTIQKIDRPVLAVYESMNNSGDEVWPQLFKTTIIFTVYLHLQVWQSIRKAG